MQDLFKLEQINVQQGKDLVQLHLGSNAIRLYYQTTFKLCAKMAGCIKFAMRHEGIKPEIWHELNVYDRKRIKTKLHHEYRRSGYSANVTLWDVDFEGSLIVLTFDTKPFKMHFSDAVKIYAWLRGAAKEAKHWAGDRSRIYSTSAMLRDAEENDKILYTA